MENIVNYNYNFNSISQLKFEFDMNRPEHNFLHDSLSRDNIYEKETSYFIFRCLKKGDCFIDIGASQGFFTLFASKLVGENGLVISIEPGEDNLLGLNKNIQLNNLTNCIVYDYVLSDNKNKNKLYLNLDNGSHTLWDLTEWKSNVKSIENPTFKYVETFTIDEIAELNKRKINIIKIDTEGAESLILKGANALLSKDKSLLILAELHEFGLKKLNCSQFEMRHYMKNLGYDTFILSSSFGRKPRIILPEAEIKFDEISNILFANKDILDKIYD
jgi:FkbM family methyltransferase